MSRTHHLIKNSLLSFLLLATLLVGGWSDAGAADTAGSKPSLKKAFETVAQVTAPAVPMAGVPEDEFNRGTPRTSLLGYLQATRERDFERAAQYLDLSQATIERDGSQLARQLRIALGRQLWVDVDALSLSPEGDQTDGLADGQDRIGRIAGSAKSYDIVLQRVPREDGVLVWKVARSTVADIPELYAEFGYPYLETILPPWFFDYRIMGIELVLWAGWIIISIAAFPVAMLLTAGVIFLARRFRPDLAADLEQFFTGPIRMLLWVLLVRWLMQVHPYIGCL